MDKNLHESAVLKSTRNPSPTPRCLGNSSRDRTLSFSAKLLALTFWWFHFYEYTVCCALYSRKGSLTLGSNVTQIMCTCFHHHAHPCPLNWLPASCDAIVGGRWLFCPTDSVQLELDRGHCISLLRQYGSLFQIWSRIPPLPSVLHTFVCRGIFCL